MTSPVPSFPALRPLKWHVFIRLLGLAPLLVGVTLVFPGSTPGALANDPLTQEPQAEEPIYPPPPGHSTPGPAVLAVTNPGGGSVVSTNVGGINCPGSCAGPYAIGTGVSLMATPAPGSLFSGWSGDCSGTNLTCSVHMDRYRYVTATFVAPLTVVAHGPGTVTTSSPGITCGSGGTDCDTTFSPGTLVTLTATPDPGKVFYSWSSSCAPGNGEPCSLAMDGPMQVDAWFGDDVPVQVLTVSLPSDYDPSPGLVTSTPDMLHCRNDTFFGWTGCWGIFPTNSAVALNSNPFGNSFLVGWEGDGSTCGSGPNCTIIMDSNHAVGARFAKMSELVLNLHKNPNFPGGSVAVGAPVNTTCDIPVGSSDRTCSWWLPLPSPVAIPLTAQPDDGSTFHWGQACSGSSPSCSPTVGGGNTTTVDTYFKGHLIINTHADGQGQGRVNISPTGNPGITSCTAEGTCVISYPVQTTVTLTAEPIGDSRFDWGTNGQTACYGVQTNDCTISVVPGLTTTVDANFYANSGAMKGAPRHVNSVSQNRPNPFNPDTVIPYSLSEEGRVRIRIYDMAGRLVRTLVDAHQQAGPHAVRWDGHAEQGRPLASGIYFYKIFYPQGAASVRTMALLR